jgi:small-conductance mechanosensitive channel
LFTALGVTSVVIGLMLQNSVGQIVSGLFMLFEQPFRIDDCWTRLRRLDA